MLMPYYTVYLKYWSEIFLTLSDLNCDTPSLLYKGYRVFLGGKDGRDMALTTHPIPI